MRASLQSSVTAFLVSVVAACGGDIASTDAGTPDVRAVPDAHRVERPDAPREAAMDVATYSPCTGPDGGSIRLNVGESCVAPAECCDGLSCDNGVCNPSTK